MIKIMMAVDERVDDSRGDNDNDDNGKVEELAVSWSVS